MADDQTLDKYKKLKVLGKGSFGKAYLVEKTECSQLCVIKQMETTQMSKQEKDDAIRESQVLKRMCHPNIVKFHEVFMTKRGRLCIVMDFADGGDLYQFLKKRNHELLQEDKILNMFTQMALAVKHVHDNKVLHRDLKTQNIFLTKDGTVKLGDFGIARVLEATKDFAKTMVGTPYYISPEIIEERPYSFKSDVWSLGVILYELTALKHPFDAQSLHDLAVKILKGKYADIDSRYTKELGDLIRKCLTVDDAKRPTLQDILNLPILKPYVDKNMAEAPSSPVKVPAGGSGAGAAGGSLEDDDDDAGRAAAAVSKIKLEQGGGHKNNADALRKQLKERLTDDEFKKAYDIVKSLGGGKPGEDEGNNPVVAKFKEFMDGEKALEVARMMQLLVFLEDLGALRGGK
uniref:non-specific serine/threonine protein kinase n=1 Tax=Chromera velia CCMP2878 TaxID=1169474 RepID=A0A0G4HLT8_9ALVE|eukprot:Cvel_7411.t1-p1 / transcript=Cvel_7411.t1 / gene=Cvel_7411 / organism=Chromera_velia_CCMP2878 / gene_product=Serine/threonine-protein kinase Nek1, putative / transcript_product=Serine/threonine-protein kinase Nek1, putative / location=Cvel_scaffold387:10290-12619(+) / protein_length=402 / sequence_SO=supercontig / SO=protein_coding / is_pseudo=false